MARTVLYSIVAVCKHIDFWKVGILDLPLNPIYFQEYWTGGIVNSAVGRTFFLWHDSRRQISFRNFRKEPQPGRMDTGVTRGVKLINRLEIVWQKNEKKMLANILFILI